MVQINVSLEEHFCEPQQYCFYNTGVDPKQAVEASLSLLKIGPEEVILPLLAVTYNSVLLELFIQAGVPVGYSMLMIGETGSMKSTLAALVLSHFGNFSNRSLPASFEDTCNSIEKKSFICKDALLVIDDIYPTSDRREKDRMLGVLQNMLRRLGNRRGRSRMDVNTALRVTYNPRCLALVTAEMAEVTTSAMARSVEIQLKRNMLDLEKLTLIQQNTGLLNAAMEHFILWISRHFDEVVAFIREMYIRVRNSFQIPGVHPQLAEHYAALYISLNIMLDYASEIEAITQEAADDLLNRASAIFLGLMNNQQQRMQDDSPAQLFVNAVEDLLATKAIYLSNANSRGNIECSRPDNPDLFGWTREGTSGDTWEIQSNAIHAGFADEEFIYFISNVIYDRVNQYLQRQNKIMPFQDKTLWKTLEEKGILVPAVYKDRLYRTSEMKVRGTNYRTIKLRRDKFPLLTAAEVHTEN